MYSNPGCARQYASEARSIHKHLHQKLEKDTDGAYKSGHLAKVDINVVDENNRVLFEGGVTYGAGIQLKN